MIEIIMNAPPKIKLSVIGTLKKGIEKRKTKTEFRARIKFAFLKEMYFNPS
ncbi:transposase [Fructobacillus pseudoficulneus]|uniref:Transposase n=1 Tax=Fructobacillus pseudoficulneus TaxID=220714 RepID=A0A3F3HA40_9LACO|nr:transposase [Fructobacillus pseudoficulneus]